MASKTIEKLIEHVAELTKHMKDAKGDLKTAIEGTELYDKVLRATLKQSTSTGCEIPDKAAKAHALKVARATYENLEEEEAEN
jgi:tryptophan 2,3-dioxygenase